MDFDRRLLDYPHSRTMTTEGAMAQTCRKVFGWGCEGEIHNPLTANGPMKLRLWTPDNRAAWGFRNDELR